MHFLYQKLKQIKQKVLGLELGHLSKMKKIIFFLFIFLNISISSNAEIAYIDINYILKTSNVGKYLNSHIEKKKIEYDKKFKDIENQLVKKEKTLISQQNILNKEEFDNKLKALTKEVQDYRKNKKSKLDNLNKFKIDNTREILKKLNPIITNYVDTNSISIVLPKKNIIVGKKNLDITDQILNLLNNKINKLDF